MSQHLIIDDEDWLAMLGRVEEPLLMSLAASTAEDGWRLPALVTGDQAREAWWRVYQLVRDGLAAARQHRLLAADRRRELAPLALVELAASDLQLLAAVARECCRALSGLGGDDLQELLGEIASTWRPYPSNPYAAQSTAEDLVGDLVRVQASLGLAPDADVTALIEVIGVGDRVLTEKQEQAYARYARRWVRAQDGSELQLFAFGA
jgi:hypothetical protein